MKRTEVGLAGGHKVEKEKSSRVSWRMNVLYQPPVHCEFIEDFPSDFLGYVRGLWPTLRASNRVVTRGEQGRHCQFNIWSSFSFCFSSSPLSNLPRSYQLRNRQIWNLLVHCISQYIYIHIHTYIYIKEQLLYFQKHLPCEIPSYFNFPFIQNSLPFKEKNKTFYLLTISHRTKNRMKIPGATSNPQ